MQQQWQPIETAPKDGSRLLLWCKRHGTVSGQWDDDKYSKRPRPMWVTEMTQLFGRTFTRENQPTHWMPLPQAPEEQQ